MYLVWSNEHEAWWGPASRGYSDNIANAGLYTREEAMKIVEDANRCFDWRGNGKPYRPYELPVAVDDLPEEAKALIKIR